MRHSYFVLALLLAGTGVGSAQQPPMLLPGDAVRIMVWQQDDFSGEFVIAADSTILHPLYREVRVAGVPLDVAEQRVRDFLSRFNENPSFAFEPLFRVFVGGEVRLPSQYSFPPATSLGEALVRAGWLTERGNPERVHLLRDGVASIVDVSDTGNPLVLMPVRSGDRITVERRRDVFREYVVPAASFVGGIFSILRFFIR